MLEVWESDNLGIITLSPPLSPPRLPLFSINLAAAAATPVRLYPFYGILKNSFFFSLESEPWALELSVNPLLWFCFDR